MRNFIIAATIIVLIAFGLAISYNGLVKMNENISGKWSQVENQMQRRSDLIPNLLNTVQGIADHEKSIVKSVTDARSAMMQSKNLADISKADSDLAGALSRLLVVVENYPQIKADANFRQLSDELAGTENRIAIARKDYNEAVQMFNTKIKTFPTVLMASMFGFSPKEYLKVPDSAKAVPIVKFNK